MNDGMPRLSSQKGTAKLLCEWDIDQLATFEDSGLRGVEKGLESGPQINASYYTILDQPM